MPVIPDYKAADTRYDGRMPYIRCGHSGVKLPAVSLGFWHNFGSVDDFDKAHDVPCLIYQGRYNLMDRSVENGILDACREHGVGFTAFSPLAQGLLTDRYLRGIPEDSRMARNHFLKRDVLTPQFLSKLNRLNAIAADRNQSLSEMALSWLLKDGLVTSVLIGASSPAQLLINIGAVRNTVFTADELYEIDSIINK